MDRARRGGSGALNPQSALAGPNPLPRGAGSGVGAPPAASMARSRAVAAREPGQVRKEAALSGNRQAPRDRRAGAAGDESRRSPGLRRGVHGPLRSRVAPPGPVGPAPRRGTLAGAADVRPLALPPPPPAHVRRGGRAGAGGPDAAQRRRAREGPPRLPLRRLARHGQDQHGEDPRGLPELRARADDRAVWRLRFLPGDLLGDLARRDRDGRRLAQRRRRCPGAARERRLRAGVRASQGLHSRRGAHAHAPGVERVPQDARGAAAVDDLRARHHRAAEDPRHGRRSLPPLRLRAAERRPDHRGAAQDRGPGEHRGAGRRARAGRARRQARSATRSGPSSSW